MNNLWAKFRDTKKYTRDTLLGYCFIDSTNPIVITTMDHQPILEYVFGLWFKNYNYPIKNDLFDTMQEFKTHLDAQFKDTNTDNFLTR